MTTQVVERTVEELTALAFGIGLRDHITAAADPRTPANALRHLMYTDPRKLVHGALVNNPGLPTWMLIELKTSGCDFYVQRMARYHLNKRNGRPTRQSRNPFEESITDLDPDHYD